MCNAATPHCMTGAATMVGRPPYKVDLFSYSLMAGGLL